MIFLKSIIIAFSMYSKIPMPQFEWKDEDMRYVMGAFPLVGALIGAFFWLWESMAEKFDVAWNMKVPSNDGGIGLGQIYLGTVH